MASKHARKSSGRASLPRRITRGPLDEDEATLTSSTTSITSPIASTVLLAPSQAATQDERLRTPDNPPTQAHLIQHESVPPSKASKDLSFLLDQAIYHPLSQLHVAPPFRRPLAVLSPNIATLDDAIIQLEIALSTCDYLSAAHLAASILTSQLLQPTDASTIFRLLGVRYSCLELTDNTTLAAQEAKALEDITSTFYYFEREDPAGINEDTTEKKALPEHMMPFSLRIQALRLQSIGFSDPRRGVTALYDLALECREHVASDFNSAEHSSLWRSRLEETSIRIVNALVEMGDLECAERTLRLVKPSQPTLGHSWTSHMILLALRIGDVVKAEELMNTLNKSSARKTLGPLLAIAEARYEDAIIEIMSQKPTNNDDVTVAMKQNLAIAYLYTGKVSEARMVLDELVAAGASFQTLIVNLSTIYELICDKSRNLKVDLANKIAEQQKDKNQLRPISNVDFKL